MSETENWSNWTADAPPVDEAYANETGWVIPLKGTDPADGLTETVVTWRNLAVTAGVPNIVAINLPELQESGWFTEDTELAFEVVFNEEVTVTGTPRIEITLTTGTVYATYDSGTGTNILTFIYTPTDETDEDRDGITLVSPIDLNSGTIKDKITTASNAALTFTVPDTTGLLVDTIAPYPYNVPALSAANYNTGEHVDIVMTFEETVVVDGDLTPPSIPIYANDGTTPIGDATYLSGSGTDELTFRYTVQGGDSEATGIKVGADLTDDDNAITDLAGHIIDDLTFSQVNMTGVTLNA